METQKKFKFIGPDNSAKRKRKRIFQKERLEGIKTNYFYIKMQKRIYLRKNIKQLIEFFNLILK